MDIGMGSTFTLSPISFSERTELFQMRRVIKCHLPCGTTVPTPSPVWVRTTVLCLHYNMLHSLYCTKINFALLSLHNIERNARYQDTFLLQPDSLSSRQVRITLIWSQFLVIIGCYLRLSAQLDNVRSLVRLGCEPKVRPSLPSLVKYTQQLINCEYCIILSLFLFLS